MDVKLSPEQAARYDRFKKFDNAQEALKQAKEEAKSSRDALYFALSAAYYWYLQIKHDFTLLVDELGKNDPEIKWPGQPKDLKNPVMLWEADKPDDPNIPQDPFTPIVKLVFGYVDRRYASTVSNYAKCLRFVDREIHDPTHFELIYEDHLNNPELAKNIIEAASGVMACAEEQHKFENPPPQKDATQEQLEKFWYGECDQIYSSRSPLETVPIQTDAPSGSYMLMMGRVVEGGGIEVVETLERPAAEIFSIAESEAFQDVSKLDPKLNLLADTAGFLNLYRAADNPVFTVEKGGAIIHLGPDNTHLAGIVVKAEVKDGAVLQGFNERAYLKPDESVWFLANAQEHKYRRIYKIQQASAAGAVSALELESQITNKKHVLSFMPMTEEAKKQVILDATVSSHWDFEILLERKDLLNLYLKWCQDWLAEFKNEEKKKAKHRLITAVVNDQGFALHSEFGIDDGFIPLKTSLPAKAEIEINVAGHELLNVFKQLLACPNFDEFRIRGAETGVIELEAEDIRAKYTVDIPMLSSDGTRYAEKHFAKLK